MEKATLKIKETKHRFEASLIFEQKKRGKVKSMPVHQFKPGDASLDGTAVEVKRDNGQPVEIRNGEQVIWAATASANTARTPTKSPEKPHKANKYSQGGAHLQSAKAPYNFVPLNDIVVPCEHREKKLPSFNTYHPTLNSGYLELKLTTETPLYIRDTLTRDDLKKEARVKAENDNNDTKYKYINPDFFSPGGRVRIPGSSLRGMLRTMVEMTSFSKLLFFEHNRNYYFRSFADKCKDIRDEYSHYMKGDENENKKKAYSRDLKAGYLVKDGLRYYVIPAKRINGNQFFRVHEEVAKKAGIIKNLMSCEKSPNKFGKNKEYEKYDMGFKPVHFPNSAIKGKKLTQLFPPNSATEDFHKGMLVCSGWIGGKCMHWVVGPPDDLRLELHDGVIENYKNDVGRDKKANLLDKFKKDSQKKVPCFYIEKDGKVFSFGQTGFFRLAFKQKLSDLIPGTMKDKNTLDIAEAIFGNESEFPGRVFFEDIFLEPGQDDVMAEETIIKVLGKPSPTTFQHYLEQNLKEIIQDGNNYKGIKHYNTKGARLRGNKCYWHKSNNLGNWEESKLSFDNEQLHKLMADNNIERKDFEKALASEDRKSVVSLKKLSPELKQVFINAVGRYETQHSKIKYVNTGKTFSGRLRFENLTNVELGALLFSLQLPQGCLFKLGMGKPLGLGSVHISSALHLSNRKERYEDLFSEWEQEVPAVDKDEKDIPDFKSNFEKYVLGKLGETSLTSLWDTSRLKELAIMLNYQKGIELETAGETRYLEIDRKKGEQRQGENEYKQRHILPIPSEVKSS